MNYLKLISFILSLFLSYISLPMIMRMLFRSNILCENFERVMIPTSMGMVFAFVQVITLSIVDILFGLNDNFNLVYLLGFIFIGMIGLLDDLIGEKTIKGLKGHIKALFNGTLTTGAIKAILGFFISFIVSFYLSNDIKNLIVNSLLISLFTNFINLFDLRPGRAIKVFIIFSFIFIWSSKIKDKNYIIYSFFGIIIPYIKFDLKAMVMMGDVGANILGFTLGVFTAVNFSIIFKIILLIILLTFHFIAEKISFSKIIDNNKVLRYIDNLGR